MSDKRVTLELSVEEAEVILDQISLCGSGPRRDAAVRVNDKTRAALAEHRAGEWEREIARLLDLPWELRDGDVIDGVGDLIVDGHSVNYEQARLMASAPALARALAGLMRWCESEYRGYPELEAARASLKLAGWPVPGEE